MFRFRRHPREQIYYDTNDGGAGAGPALVKDSALAQGPSSSDGSGDAGTAADSMAGAAPGATPAASPPGDGTDGASPPALGEILRPDGTYADGWLQRLGVPEEVAADQQLATHKSLADTVKNLHSLMKIRGDTVVPIPAADAPAEKWDLVFDRLGRPADPDGYTLPAAPPGLDGATAPDEFTAEVRRIAHAARLTDAQFGPLVEGWNALIADHVTAAASAAETARAEALRPLRLEWGPQFEAKSQAARAWLQAEFPADAVEAMEASGVLDHPGVRKRLAALAAELGETEPDYGQLGLPVASQAAAQQELDRLRALPAYTQPYDPEHKQLVRQVNRIREMLLADQQRQEKTAAETS